MQPRLLVRVDAGAHLGLGHVMRMIALAEAWCAAGGAATFMGRWPAGVGSRVRALGDVVAFEGAAGGAEDAAATRELAERSAAAWVVADGYAFSTAWQRELAGRRLLVVDDNAENAPYEADAVLNVNLHASPALYGARAAKTRLLLGPTWALVRAEFCRAARATSTLPARAARWLVTMGGADPSNATGRFLEEVARSGAIGAELEVLVAESNPHCARLAELAAGSATPIVLNRAPADVSVPMARAELALSASGGTVWELAVVGVPAAVLTVAANQRQLSEALAKRGAVEWLGEAGDGAPERWVGAMKALAADPERRASLVARARETVDGQGAARVVKALREVSD